MGSLVHKLLLVYGVLECVHIVLAAVQRSSGDVHTHGVDADIVWREEGESEETRLNEKINVSKTISHLWDKSYDYTSGGQFLTYIMSLIKHHYRFLSQLFGHQVSYLGVQQVVIAVYYDVGMKDLRGNNHYPSIMLTNAKRFRSYCSKGSVSRTVNSMILFCLKLKKPLIHLVVAIPEYNTTLHANRSV